MLKKISPALIVGGLTLFIYLLTKNPATQPFRIQLALLSLIATMFYAFVLNKKGEEFAKASSSIYMVSVTVLFIVGATGWFFSPFFFTLYLLAIIYAFIFTPAVSMSFLSILVVLFSFNIGEVDIAYDFLVVLSLLVTIPVSLYLRKEYLKLKEYEKKILILESEQKNFQDVVEKVLANKMTNFAANLKQPVNDTKQLAFAMRKLHHKEDIEKNRERIIEAADEAINYIKSFEEEVTGLKLLSNKDIQSTSSNSGPSGSADQDLNQSLSKKPSHQGPTPLESLDREPNS